MMKRRHAEAGLTLTELMVVVAILGVCAVLAMPRLARGRQAHDTIDFARQVAKSLEVARIRAVSTRHPYTVTLASTLVTTSYVDDGGTTRTERLAYAPDEARIWSVAYTQTTPT